MKNSRKSFNTLIIEISYSGEWRSATLGHQLPAAFCLRFSRPIIFSSASIKKLSKIASVELNAEGSYNLYQYLLNESEVGTYYLYFLQILFSMKL